MYYGPNYRLVHSVQCEAAAYAKAAYTHLINSGATYRGEMYCGQQRGKAEHKQEISAALYAQARRMLGLTE
jgi:hypothetical protein